MCNSRNWCVFILLTFSVFSVYSQKSSSIEDLEDYTVFVDDKNPETSFIPFYYDVANLKHRYSASIKESPKNGDLRILTDGISMTYKPHKTLLKDQAMVLICNGSSECKEIQINFRPKNEPNRHRRNQPVTN